MSKKNPLDTEVSVAHRRVEQGAQSRARLIEAARALFERDGYARTSTEGLLAATALTRGALYHHFRDKKDLFLAVCEQMHAELAAAIEQATAHTTDPREQLVAGSLAWIEAVARPGARQVLLIDAPAVLGDAQWADLDGRHGYRQLREVVGEILSAGPRRSAMEIDAMAAALNGAINALAHWFAGAGTPKAKAAALAALRRSCDAVLDA